MIKRNTYLINSRKLNRIVMFLSYTIPLFLFAINDLSANTSDTNTIIHEENFILINGIEQWVTIHGQEGKPVILFLHGGPGSPISPYAATLYKDWEKDFIIVQWDQRGAGRTFGRIAPSELTPEFLRTNPLTVDQMVDDGIELSEHLLKQLDKKKIILFGTSWGSVLGIKMASKKPELFYGYVGHSQITNPADDLMLYKKVYQLAEKSKDTAALKTLNMIGTPPYREARNIGKLFRIIKKYERLHSIAAPDSWFSVLTAYDNEKDNQNRSDGDDYSFVNYVGDAGLGIMPMRATINLVRHNIEFEIPVYFIQGNEDLLTTKEATKKYFDSIKAPEKKYFLLPNTAHGFNSSVLKIQYRIFKTISEKIWE